MKVKNQSVKVASSRAQPMETADLVATLKAGLTNNGTVKPELMQAMRESGVLDGLIKEATAHLEGGGNLLAGDVRKLQGAMGSLNGASHELTINFQVWEGGHEVHEAAQEIIWNLPKDGPVKARVTGGFPHINISARGTEKDLKALKKKLAPMMKSDPRPRVNLEPL